MGVHTFFCTITSQPFDRFPVKEWGSLVDCPLDEAAAGERASRERRELAQVWPVDCDRLFKRGLAAKDCPLLIERRE